MKVRWLPRTSATCVKIQRMSSPGRLRGKKGGEYHPREVGGLFKSCLQTEAA